MMNNDLARGGAEFTAFDRGMRVVVVGAGGGLGAALVQTLAAHLHVGSVYALTRSPDKLPPMPSVRSIALNYDDVCSIEAAADVVGAEGELDLVIVATGLLHDGALQPEKDWRHLNQDQMSRVFQVNTIGPALVAKAFLPLMRRDQHSVFAALAARVGSISDNRIGGWYSYRASKAALVMLIRCLAIELKRKRRPTICVALHPGTVDTALSEPFQASTRPGQVVTPEVAARNLLGVIAGLSEADTGKQFAWDGAEIAP